MTLIELMWALVVFGIVATGIAYGLIASTNVTRLDRDRVQAANLAARELEITRSEFMNSGDGATTLGATSLVVNPHPLPTGTGSAGLSQFTVTRTVQWVPAGTGTSTCDGGTTVTYPSLAVDVKVTWPRMGNVKPVVSHTVLTPPKGSLNSSLAFVGIKVLRADGSPATSQAVNLSGPSSATRLTADDGCAVFALSTAGTYSASLSTAGYVDYFGVTAPSKTVVATAGKLAQASFNYDQAASLTLTATAPSGYALPTTLPTKLQMYNTGITPSGLKTVTMSGTTTTVTNLWPFTDGYALWPGSCNQSDPVKAGGSRAASTVVAPGASGSAALQFLPVSVTVLNNAGAALPGAQVIATPNAATGCAAPETSGWVVGTTGSGGVLKTALPAGSWTMQVASRTSLSGTWPLTGNLTPGSAAVAVVAQISTVS